MNSFIAAILMITLAGAEETLSWKQLPPLPEPLGVAAPFAGTSGGALLVAGGANFPGKMPWEGGKKVWTDKVWVLEHPNAEWREAGTLPRPLGYGVSVTAGSGVVCVGGSDSSRHYADAFRFVWNGAKLLTEPLPSLPIPVSGASGALVNGTLYVACGAEVPGEQSATNRAFALELAAKDLVWRELPPLPGKPRLLAAGSAHDGAFYVLGGAAIEPDTNGKMSRVYLREAWSFRPVEGWRRHADLPKPSVAAPAPAPVIDGSILLLSGDDGSRVGFSPVEAHPGFPRAVLCYSPALNSWREYGEVPAPRATVPVAEWSGMFVIPSGEVRPGVRSPEVWAITPR